MRSFKLLLTLSGILPWSAAAQGQYSPTGRGHMPSQPYSAYDTMDSLGRTIRFYVSESAGTARLPLIVYVHGSGHQSLFQRTGDRIVPAGGHATLVDVARGRARVAIVEKPGVELYESGSSPPSETFRFEQTLDRWAEAVTAITMAARRLPGIDPSRLLVIGHSEGGLVAARVAARLPEVTHVGILAGGGPSQLFDLVILAREGKIFSDVSADPAIREAFVMAQWDSILADPESATREFFGHPFRRWASFLRDSPMAALRNSAGKVFMAQGAADQVVSRASFDALASDLMAAGRAPVVRFIAGADHSFAIRLVGEEPRDGWAEILASIVTWYVR